MTADEVRALLQAACVKAGSVNAWAVKHKISRAHVGLVLKGDREPGEKILKPLGLEVDQVVYRMKGKKR